MTAVQYDQVTGTCLLSTPEPKVHAAVFATNRPGVFHVRMIETAPGGETLRQGAYRLRAASARIAAVAALWLFRHTCHLLTRKSADRFLIAG